MPSAPLGREVPRLWTPPLGDLTPETTDGYEAVEFTEQVLGWTLIPWQRWLLLHALEKHPDGSGRPRFRQVLVLVARQQGKSQLCVLMSSYWQFLLQVPLVLGTATNLDLARESWNKAVDLAQSNDFLSSLVPKNGVRRAAGQEELKTVGGSRYKIATSSRTGGRGLTVHRLICDELREHQDWDALGAAMNAMNAVPDGQAWLMTNAGDDKSVVLNSIRDTALRQIETGSDEPIGIFEWSAPDGCELDDVEGMAQANPSLGYTMRLHTLMGYAEQAKADPSYAAVYRTESLCQRVAVLNAAIDPHAWRNCVERVDMSHLRDRTAMCIDVAPDSQHATIAVAAMDEGKVRTEIIQSFTGPRAADDLRREVLALVRRVRPRVLGWFPSGPAAALVDVMTNTRRTAGGKVEVTKRLGGVPLQAITAEVPAVCLSFAEAVQVGSLRHPDDDLLNAHVLGADRQQRGDQWVFSRRGNGHVDAVYAAAGAVHLARTLPSGLGKPRILSPVSD